MYLDANSGVGVLGLVVPGATRWALTWGVIATYLVASAVITSWPRKRLRPKLWRTVHLGSVIGAALAGLHTYQAGSDASGRPLQIALVLGGAASVYALSVRVLGLGLRRRSSISQRAHGSDPPDLKP